MALDIVVSVASEIVKSTLCAAVRQVRYSFCFNKYVKDLEEEKNKLISTRKSVQDRAEKAKCENKKIDDGVEKLLKGANSLTEEADKLEIKAKGNQSCCFGHCPNFIWRYRVGKQVAEKANALKELNQNIGGFKEFARTATLPGMNYFPSEDFIFFDSTKEAYDQLLMALKNEEASMIGLYAMGGSGKTTLVKQLGKAVEKDFKKVVFVVVSTTVDVQRIQGEIASYLGLKLEGKETLTERARSLWLRLSSGEKILIILDDVWEKLDFEAIGIPFGENCKNCTVLLTTRRVQVCTLMGCQGKILLSLLGEEEAWTLYQKHAGITDKTSDSLKGMAKEIAKECGRLPVAIAAVASTLKGKTQIEWKEALEKLREATPIDVEEGLRNPYTCLQLSYDNLKSEEAKSFFLLCSVFPEDFEIHEEYLARYGIGLGLFGEFTSYERARNQVSAAKNKLIDSCLLLKADKEQCVKMHDLVRDVALWIAKKEKKVIIGPESRALKKNVTLEDNTIRYLWCDELHKLSDLLNYPKLEFLYVKISKNSIMPDGFLKGMTDLRVLVLQYEKYWEKHILTVTKSIQWPTNLRCLFLKGWKLDDVSFLSSLKTLEALVLWNCSFQELTDEITELTKLRLLDLRRCKIERNPYEVIGRCSKLEELYFVSNEGSGWEKEGQVTAVFLDKNNATSVLQRYRIEIGTDDQFGTEDFSITRGLRVTNFDAFTCNAAIKDLLLRAEVLQLYKIKKGCKNIIPDIIEALGGGVNELAEFMLYRSDNIECLVDTTNHLFKAENVFSKLVKLDISYMQHFETLWRGPHVGKLNLLCSLKELELYKCPMLTSVFTCAVAQSLVLLEKLRILYCDKLKHILTDDEKNIVDQKSSSSTSVFPKLKKFLVQDCNQLEYLIPVSLAGGLVQLESLKIEDAAELEYVFGQSVSYHADQNENRFQIIDLPVLRRLRLSLLPNIIAICPENYYPAWPSLNKLEWLECPRLNVMSINKCILAASQVIKQQGGTPQEEEELGSLVMLSNQMINEVPLSNTLQNLEKLSVINCEIEGIFQLSGHTSSRELQPFIPCLKHLCLENLDELIYICKGPRKFISLQNLQELRVHRCRKLKCIFTASTMGSLPQLEVLHVEDCEQLEQIIEDEEPQKLLNRTKTYEVDHCPNDTPTSFVVVEEFSNAPQNPVFSRLKDLKIIKCNILEFVFPISFAQELVKLEKMLICENPQLKYIFSQSNHESISSYQSQNTIQIELPLLKEISVQCLPNIISICPENYVFKCPSLQEFSLDSLGLQFMPMNTLMNDSEVRQRNHNSAQEEELGSLVMLSSQMTNEVPLSKNLQNMEKLSVINCKIEGIFQLSGHTSRELQSFIPCLKHLCLKNLDDLIYICRGPSKFISLQNLQELKVHGCRKLKRIFTASTIGSLPQLEVLHIEDCDQLKKIIEDEESPKLLNITEIYEVDCCPKNTSISFVAVEEFPNAPPNPVFSRLKDLKITKCNILEFVFPISFARELVKLEKMLICENPQLKYIFSQSHHGSISSYQSENTIQIELPLLKEISVQCLPNIISICPENCVFKCPSLQKFSLQEFSLDSLGLQLMTMNTLMNGSEVRLRNHNSAQETHELVKDEIQLNAENNDLQIIKQLQRLEVGNCNIGAIFQLEGFPISGEQGPMIFSLSHLKLDNLSELKFLCNGPIQSVHLKNLTRISVVRCRKLKIMFSSSILRSFPQLRWITIRECDQLEQIIEEDEKDQSLSNYHSQLVCFPSLTEIEIQQCNNLKYLFTVSSSHEIPPLRELLIEECCLLYNVFPHKESEIEDGQAIMLPKLWMLRLIKLPNLINISEGFKWQSVEDHKVEDCPKLTLTTTAPSKDLPQEYQNPVEEEDKESKREEEHKGEGEVKLGNMNVIQQSATSYPESRDDHKAQVGTPSMDGTSLSATTASGLREANAIQDKIEVSSQTALTNPNEGKDTDSQTSTNQDVNLSAPIAATNKKCQVPEEGSNQNKMEDKNPLDAQESLQEQNINFREKLEQKLMNIKETAKERHQKGSTPDKSTEATSSLDLEVKEPTGKLDQQEGLEQNQVTNEFLDRTGVTSPISQSSSFLANAAVYPGDMSSGLDLNKATETIMDFPKQCEDSYQGQRNDGKIKHHLDNLNSVVGSSGEGPPELPPSVPVARNVHDNIPAGIPVKAANFNRLLLESDSALIKQHTPEGNKGASTSSSARQEPLAEELVKFRGLFKVDARHASLLEEAFSKYPHLWEWQWRFRPKYIKWGYKSLADMLLFLKSETPKAMDDSRREEFEKLYAELQSFGFDKGWLTSIHQRVIEVQVDNEKLKQLEELESRESALQDELNNVRATLAKVRDDLSKYDTAFDF